MGRGGGERFLEAGERIAPKSGSAAGNHFVVVPVWLVVTHCAWATGERQWLMVQAAAPGVHYCPAFPTHFKHSANNAGASHVSLWGNEEPVWGKGCSLDSWKDKCCPSGVYYLGQHCTRQEWVQTGTWVCLDMGQKYRSHRWGER